MPRSSSAFATSTSAVAFALAMTLLIGGCGNTASTVVPRDAPVPDGDVVAVFGDQVLTAQEFDEQYERSVSSSGTSGADTAESRSEFLERYVNFRLKVLEAKALGYHEREDLRTEMLSYREQLARPYLLGQEVTDPLVRELYDRRSTAVEASHILLTVPENAPPADTMRAYSRISMLRDSVLAGADFGDVASRHSMDPSARREPGQPGARGALGWFGGGRMVKAFEDQAFSTEPGNVSPVFRSPFGYHILMVEDRMPMPAARELAHIMFQPRGPSAADSAEADNRLSQALERLNSGESFAEVAEALSDDRNSARNGGIIGTLSFDQGLPPAMRDAAFSLQEPGDVSEPVETQFGKHIIQFVSESPLGALEDEYESLKAQVGQLPRSAAAQTAFARSLQRELGARVDTALVDSWTRNMSADSLYRWLVQSEFEPETGQLPIVFLGDSTWTVSRFVEDFRTRRIPSRSGDAREGLLTALTAFLDDRAVDYEVARLEFTDPDFGRTMQEFRDGLVLFKLMEDSVWTAASGDSTGLLRLFEQRGDAYRWPDRVRVASWSSPRSTDLETVRESLRMNSGRDAIVSDTTLSVRLDTTWVESETGSVFDAVLHLSEGQTTDVIQYNNRFLMLEHLGMEPARPKTFEEARAELVNDYQQVLEERLVQRLRTKYAVQTWPERTTEAR
ncbi:MAG: peptidylprolyl isomerase [Rhodothermales bacterium]